MRVFISFIIAFFISSFMLFFLFFFLFYKKPEPKVYIHTAIIAPKKSKVNRVEVKKAEINKKQHSNKISKVTKSKSSITKGGEVDFNDIFKNVDYNVKTDKVKLEEVKDLSRLKGIKEAIKNIKSSKVEFKIAKENLSNSDIKDEVLIKLQNVWNEISSNVGEYAKIKLVVKRGDISVFVIKSNLSSQKQLLLIRKIKSLNFKKDFYLTITFRTKVQND